MKLYSLFGIVAFFPIWSFRANLDYLQILFIFIIFFFGPLFLHFVIIKKYSLRFNIFFCIWMSLLFVYSVDQNIGLWTISLRIVDLTISNYIISSIFLLIFFILILSITSILKINGIKIFFSIIVTIFILNILDTSRNYSNFPKVTTDNKFNEISENNNQKLILIFDEMSGITSEDSSHITGKKATNAILNVFKNNNFNVYTNIFSLFTSTKRQIPSTLNFITSEKQYILKEKIKNENFLYLRKSKNYFQTFDLVENSFFDQDYINKIVIYQSMYLNYCKHEKVYNCHQYNPFDKNKEFLNGFKDSYLTKIISAYKNNASSVSSIIWRLLRHLNIIDSILEPEGEKASFKFILKSISKSLENKDVDLVFAHILVPHIPYGFNAECKYDGSRGSNFNFMTIDEKRAQHNLERECVAFYLNNFFKLLKEKNIYNNLEIMIFSDHDSRIAEDRLGSSVIFAKKESNSETSKIITKKTYSNLIFADNYKRIK